MASLINPNQMAHSRQKLSLDKAVGGTLNLNQRRVSALGGMEHRRDSSKEGFTLPTIDGRAN